MATVADIRATLASSRTRLEAVAKYNPYHGVHGEFAHGPGSATGKAEAHASASHADVEPGPSDGKHGHLSSSGSHPSEHDHTKPTEVPKMTHATVREDTAALAPFEPKQPYYSQGQIQAHAHDMVAQRILDDPALLRAVGINPGRADYSATKARAAVLAKVQRAANTWAGTSGDSNPPALAFQRAVSEEFGLQKQWKVLERHVIGGGGAAAANTTVEATDALHAKHGPENRAIARAMYEHTQQELKDAGIESVTLFRGVRLDGMPGLPAPNAPKWSNYLKRNNIAHQPASSYTAELRLAASFAGLGATGPAPYQSGHVIVLQVPRERILAAGFTGLGTMYEREYVLLGGTTPGKNLIVGPDSRAPSSGVVLKPPKAKKWLDDLYALVEAQKYNTHHGVHGQFASTDGGAQSSSAKAEDGSSAAAENIYPHPPPSVVTRFGHHVTQEMGERPGYYRSASGASEFSDELMDHARKQGYTADIALRIKNHGVKLDAPHESTLPTLPEKPTPPAKATAHPQPSTVHAPAAQKSAEDFSPGSGKYTGAAEAYITRGEDVYSDRVYGGAKRSAVARTADTVMADPKSAKLFSSKREAADLAADFISSWGLTVDENGDVGGNVHILSIHRAVAEELGLSKSTHGLSEYLAGPETVKASGADYAKNGAKYRAVARAIYANTQADLAAHGVTHVTLYRGLGFGDADKPKWYGPATARVPHPSLSAYSADRGTSEEYAAEWKHPALISADVPASRIFSTGRTGAGNIPEFEYVVLGSGGNVKVEYP